jgi:site-specific recombinase XerD
METTPLDRRGYYRSRVTFATHRLGKKPPNAGRKFPVETLTREEARALLAACGRGYAGARDRAGVVLMYRAGLRIAELLALMVKDLDLAAGMVTVLHGKGDRRRTIPVDPQAMALVELWLERRRELGLNGRHPFFCTIAQPNPGDPYWSSVLREKLKRAGTRAGITKRVHPHGLRHTYATELAIEGVPVHVIRALLGHNSLDTTQRYIAKLHPADLARFVHQREWDPPTAHEASAMSAPIRGAGARARGDLAASA